MEDQDLKRYYLFSEENGNKINHYQNRDYDEISMWKRMLSDIEVYILNLSMFGSLSISQKLLLLLFPRQYPILIDRKRLEDGKQITEV